MKESVGNFFRTKESAEEMFLKGSNDSCDIISSQIFELLKYPVICKYDTQEVLYIVEVFDVPFEDFDRVEKIIFDYSNDHVTQFGTFCIPVIYTPEQSINLK